MMQASGNRIWTRGFALAFATKLCSACVFIIYTSTLVVYLHDHYQASSGVAGLAVGIFILSSVAGRILSAQLDTLFTRKSILLVSSFLLLILSVAYLCDMALVPFFVLRALHGIAFGFLNNAITVVATELLPPTRLGEGLGIYAISVSTATTLAPLTGVLLMQALGYRAVMWAAVVFAALAFMTVALQRRSVIDVRAERAVRKESSRRIGLSDFLEKPALPISILVALACMCYAGSVTPYVASYSELIGLGSFSFLYFAVYTVTLLAARPLMGMVQDRRGSSAIMYPALVCLALGLLVLALMPSLLGIVLAGILLGIGHGTVFSGGQTIAVRLSGPDRVGFATSTYFAFSDFGTGVGPAILGVVFGQLGYGGMYLCAAAIAAILIPGHALVYRCSRPRKSN